MVVVVVVNVVVVVVVVVNVVVVVVVVVVAADFCFDVGKKLQIKSIQNNIVFKMQSILGDVYLNCNDSFGRCYTSCIHYLLCPYPGTGHLILRLSRLIIGSL